MTGVKGAQLERAGASTAVVLICQTPVDTPLRRGPMSLPNAIALCHWFNGAAWPTQVEHNQLPRTWADLDQAVA